MRRLEVLLKIFNLSVQRDAEHVDLLQVLVAAAREREIVDEEAHRKAEEEEEEVNSFFSWAH